jgi:hypothetical protein
MIVMAVLVIAVLMAAFVALAAGEGEEGGQDRSRENRFHKVSS